MKKITLLAVLIGGIALGASAQIRRTVTPKPKADSTGMAVAAAPAEEKEMNRREVMDALNLSKEQKKQLKAQRREAKSRREAIEADTKLSQEEKDRQLRELRRAEAEKTDKVLNEEQKEKMKEIRRKVIKEKRAKRGITGRPDERGAGAEAPKQ